VGPVDEPLYVSGQSRSLFSKRISDFIFLLRLYFIVRLQLADNNLEGTIPPQLGLMENLRKSVLPVLVSSCLSLLDYQKFSMNLFDHFQVFLGSVEIKSVERCRPNLDSSQT
jgi:hypothetical protein